MYVGIKEIANATGVSTATVSRVLNNKKYVNEDVRRRIMTVAVEMNYQPNHLAKSLLRQKTNIIGVVVSDVASSFFSTMLKSIERCADERDYSIMICNIEGDLKKEKKYLNHFKKMCVDGIILTHEQVDEEIISILKTMNDISLLACSCKFHDIDCTSINIDDFRAAYDAIKYICQCNHKKIAYFGDDLTQLSAGKRRYEGVLQAFSDFDITVNPAYIKLSSLKISDGYRMMKEVLVSCKNSLPTAVFAGSDELAVGALNCIIDFGYSPVEDISVVGFDNSMISENVRPALTTVNQPISEIGYLAVSYLIDLIENKGAVQQDIILPHAIVERESCKKL